MSVKERLTEYLKYKKISKRQFEISIGVSNGYVTNMRKSIKPERIESIALIYSDLNTGWLMTGEGEMIKTAQQDFPVKTVTIPADAWDIIQKQANSLEMKDRQMDELISIIKKDNARKEDNAGCAAASGSDLER